MNVGTEQVLLVEDDLVQARLLRRIIKHETDDRFDVRHAASLEEALKELSDADITVVLTDLSLPDRTGVDTYNAIHSARPELPVVILSGIRDEEFAVETVRQGAQDYLVKGRDNGAVIVRSLLYAIERKRVHEEWRKMMTIRDQERRLEALGVVSTGLAHEINTPLQFVGTNIEFLSKLYASIEDILNECEAMTLLDEQGDDIKDSLASLKELLKDSKFVYMRSQMESVVKETTSGISRVNGIVKAMRVFSRQSNGEHVRYDVNQAVRDAITISRNEWKNFAEMRTHLDDDLPPVSCVPEEISQAILNLIINSAHAVEGFRDGQEENGVSEKGVIDISTAVRDGGVEMVVADSGGGIAEEIRSRIFEPFFTTKDVSSGTGQGLGIVRQIIVHKHGGTVDYESRLGEGTVFKLFLPFESDAAESSGGAVLSECAESKA